MEGCLPRGILSQSGGDGVAQDALIHLRGSIFARITASRTTSAPSCVAEKSDKAP